MAEGRSQKLLMAGGLVLIVVLVLYVMRLNERIDGQARRAGHASDAAQCLASCDDSYATARRRCSVKVTTAPSTGVAIKRATFDPIASLGAPNNQPGENDD